MDMSFEEKVRERAYQIWMAAGQTDGAAHDHWFSAEQAVKSEGLAVQAGKAKVVKAAAKPKTAKVAAPAKTASAPKKKAATAKGSTATH